MKAGSLLIISLALFLAACSGAETDSRPPSETVVPDKPKVCDMQKFELKTTTFPKLMGQLAMKNLSKPCLDIMTVSCDLTTCKASF